MNGHGYAVELEGAREVLNNLRKIYRKHATGRDITKRYKIEDRGMEFFSLTDLLKQMWFWQREITRLKMAAGISSHRSNRIVTWLQGEIW